MKVEYVAGRGSKRVSRFYLDNAGILPETATMDSGILKAQKILNLEPESTLSLDERLADRWSKTIIVKLYGRSEK
jgi:hypothetical protein